MVRKIVVLFFTCVSFVNVVIADVEISKKAVRCGSLMIRPGNLMIISLPHGEEIPFVKCKAGNFTMGWDKEAIKFGGALANTPHKVIISKDFWMAQFLVTKGQWVSVMDSNYEELAKIDKDWIRLPKQDVNIPELEEFIRVVSEKYARSLPDGYELRLPTEAEWEYAKRSCGTLKRGAWGCFWPDKRDFDKVGVCAGLHINVIKQVGSLAPNPLGIYDLYGLGSQLTLDLASAKDNAVVASKRYGWITKVNYKVAFGDGAVKDPWVYYEGDSCLHMTRGDVCDVAGNKRLSDVAHAIRLVVAPKREKLTKGKWK